MQITTRIFILAQGEFSYNTSTDIPNIYNLPITLENFLLTLWNLEHICACIAVACQKTNV